MKPRRSDSSTSIETTSPVEGPASAKGSNPDAHISSDGGDVSHKENARGIRRRPSQERAAVTVEAILQAAAELFCSIGYDRASTNRIAERAGVSIGSLYQYFANKEATLAALLEDHQRAVHAVVDEGLHVLADPEVDLRRGLETFMMRLVDLHSTDPELNRVLTEEVPHLSHASANDDEFELYSARVVELLRRRPVITRPNLKLAAAIVVTTVEAVTRRLAHGSASKMNTRAVVHETAVMLAEYLESDADEEPERT